MRHINVYLYNMKRKLLVISLLFFVFFLSACNEDADENNKETERVVPVEVTEAKVEDFIIEKSVFGRTEPKEITPIMVPMPGELTELLVKNGEQVKKDDLIAKVTTQAGVQEIKAPANGEIAQLSAKEESLISDSEPLAVILNLDELTITFAVTNNVRVLFENEKDLKITVEGKEYDTKIETIGKLPNDTGLYPVEATVKNKDANVLPGMIGVVSLPEKRVEKAVILPTEAIVEETEGVFVYKVVDKNVQKIEVEIIESQTDQTAVEGDLKDGDEVVINGQLTLSDGVEVVITKEGNES